ncbi:hypothetical protein [Roseiconus lacunae]|uniref:hypothetical protein n=1 Tax=Roseiconus lacunae TaxID=2605694 RepID=UPI001E3249C6|nr:hypothetical protein [Roseiconus lacunae]MCD0459150.1 hypothetical protein [Roseiconus lacunae]
MVLDSKFKAITAHFGIQAPEDWTQIRPEEIQAIENIGPQTVNHLRLHLANHGLTLLDDKTPAYWQQYLTAVRGSTAIAANQKAVTCPFTILVDKAEQQPFRFAGMYADANQQNRPMIVNTRSEHLGPTHGDYTIAGLERWVHIERKSQSDVIGTVLGWGERREQFERTLQFLSEIPSSAVIIESSLGDVITALGDPTHPGNRNSRKSPNERKKIFHRQYMAWHDDYRVPWVFCDTRRLAEISTFRWLARQWKKARAAEKQAETNQSINTTGL